jgi:ABC-type multidrug transport system fused ATPase/permease subunit
LVLLVQGALKFALRLYQGWLSESAIRYTREHLSKIYACRIASGGDLEAPASDDSEAATPDEEDDAGRREAADGAGSRAGGGRAVSIIGAEVDKLGGFVGEAYVSPVINIGTVVAILGYMLIVETAIALVALAFLVPQLVLTPLVQRRINRLTEERVGLMRELGDLVANEPVESKLPDGEDFQRNLDTVFGNRMRIFFWKFLLKGLINISNHLATLCVLTFGGWLAIAGETSVGVIIAFVTGFERVADPMRRVLNFYRTAQLAAVQHRMIARIL